MKLRLAAISFATVCFFNLCVNELSAEIEKISISWNSVVCQQSCADGLVRQFKKISGVDEINMDAGAGRMEIRWKPNAGLTYQPINNAMAMIGVSIRNIRVRVRGVLQHDNATNRIRLVSLGDNTRFDLINPVIPSPHQQADQFNPSTRGLTPENVQMLLDAERQGMIATIEGPWFQPERSPPNLLVLEDYKFTKPEADKTKKR